MLHRFCALVAFTSLMFLAPRPAEAAITTLFDTVDAVQVTTVQVGRSNLIITGIPVNGTTPVTRTFTFQSGEEGFAQARQCERLAVLAMSKPGKYQFGAGSTDSYGYDGGCKLIRRTP